MEATEVVTWRRRMDSATVVVDLEAAVVDLARMEAEVVTEDGEATEAMEVVMEATEVEDSLQL